MNKRKIWSKELEEALETLVDSVKSAIIMDAENFADFMDSEEVDGQCLSVANFKAICLLKHANDAVIMKSLGPEMGLGLIESLELSAQKNVTEVLYDELKDKIPPELRDVFKSRFENLFGGDKESDDFDGGW